MPQQLQLGPVILALGGALLWALPAQAQDSSKPAESQDGTPPAAAEAPAPGDIIVTARRRNENIQTTPIAVTAIAPSQLEAAAAVTIGDLQGAAPNVLITTQATGAATANISIRGIAFADVEKSFDPAVGVNVDGVYIGTSTGQMLDFFDIASIEILRGPQGTLFGRNTIAGVINVRRTRPTGEWGGKFEASLGTYGEIGAKGVLNVPVVPGVLAAKLFAFHTDGDGYYTDITTGQHRGGSKNDNFGASFLLTPSSHFDALLTLEKQVQHFDPVIGSLTQTGDAFCAFLPICGGNNTTDIYKVFPAPGQFGRYSSPAATLEMNLDTGPVKFTSVSSYRKSTEDQVQDFATAGLYVAHRQQNYWQFSQELRAAGKVTDGLDYVAGVYYFKSKYDLTQNTLVFGGAAPTQVTKGTPESYAGFIDFDWKIFDRVRISGGGRYTHDEKSLQTSVGATAFPLASKSWNKFTPKLGIDYRPTDTLMLYGSWSRGYRSGGFNGRGLTLYSATTPYNPETVDAFEAGFKSEFWNRRITFNVAGFYTKYKDIQESTTVSTAGGTGNETIVANAAAAKIKGIEADLTLRPVDNFTIRSSFGYTDAKFNGFIVNQPVTVSAVSTIDRTFDFSNVNLIYAPKVTWSVNAEYSVPFDTGGFSGKVKLNAGYRYLSRYDQQIAADPAIYATAITAPAGTTIVVPRNDPRLRSDAQNLVDASISFIFDMNKKGATARLTFYARNLLDDRGTNTAFDVAAFPVLWGFAAAREPRTYGVQLGFEF